MEGKDKFLFGSLSSQVEAAGTADKKQICQSRDKASLSIALYIRIGTLGLGFEYTYSAKILFCFRAGNAQDPIQ